MDPAPHAALAQRLQGLNIFLVGMMGSGKSRLGPLLAEALGYRFIDADRLLEQTAARSISEIFASDGEDGFRAMETAVLDAISPWQRLVVATGGGVVSRPVNWGYLRQGLVVWLDAPEALLLQRLTADPTPRPLLASPDPAARLAELLAQRRPLYAQADLHLRQGDDPPEAIVEQLLAALPGVLKERPAEGQTPPPVQLVDDRGQPRSSIN